MTEKDIVEVLYVEDNPHDAELTLRALKKNHLANNLVHVKDGAEALEFLFGAGQYQGRNLMNGPKMILLDLKLPKVDGTEIIKRAKEDDRTKDIPIIVLTSSKEESDIVKSYKLGVNSYIVKPVDFDKFTRSVVELGFYWLLLNQPPVR